MSHIDPSRIDDSGRYKTQVLFHNQEAKTQDSVSMLSVALLYILAMAFPADNALPLYSDTALTPHEGKFRCFLNLIVTEISFNFICKRCSNRHMRL